MNKLFLCTGENRQYRHLFEQSPLVNCQLVNDIEVANLILADPPLVAPLLPRCQQLKWMQSTFAGINTLITPQHRKDYQLTRMTEGLGLPIAEYVFGWWIQHQRQWNEYQIQQKNQYWQPYRSPNLQGQTLLILGSGTIAQAIAKVGAAFGTQNWAINTTGRSTPFFESVFQWKDIKTIASEVDIIVNALPDTPQTRHQLDHHFFSGFKNAIFFNIGRGSAIVESDLLNALTNQYLAHAFLDVFKQEPLPQNHPFWSHKAITVTPHIAALSDPSLVMAAFQKNYLLWEENKQLIGNVNWKLGY